MSMGDDDATPNQNQWVRYGHRSSSGHIRRLEPNIQYCSSWHDYRFL